MDTPAQKVAQVVDGVKAAERKILAFGASHLALILLAGVTTLVKSVSAKMPLGGGGGILPPSGDGQIFPPIVRQGG